MLRTRGWLVAGITGACLALGSRGAEAQIGIAAAAEAAGDKVYVLYAGASWVADGTGFRPVANLGGYLLFGDAEGWGITPAGGLRYRTESGFIQGLVGWAIRDEGGSDFFGGGDNGLHTALHTEFFGDVYNAQGLASFNWGAEYLWSRARVGRRLGTTGGGGSWGLGAELVYQAQMADFGPGIDGYSATQVGPVLQWMPRADGPSFAFSGGLKRTDFTGGGDNTWYLKGEVFIP